MKGMASVLSLGQDLEQVTWQKIPCKLPSFGLLRLHKDRGEEERRAACGDCYRWF